MNGLPGSVLGRAIHWSTVAPVDECLQVWTCNSLEQEAPLCSQFSLPSWMQYLAAEALLVAGCMCTGRLLKQSFQSFIFIFFLSFLHTDIKFISNPPSMIAAGSVVAAVQGLHLGNTNTFLSYQCLTHFLSQVIKCDPVSNSFSHLIFCLRV